MNGPPPTPTPTPEALMDLYRQNPERGFDLLYETFAGRLTGYLQRMFDLTGDEVEDVVHDTFLPWVEQPAAMAGVRHPVAYLFTTARRFALQVKSRRSRPLPAMALVGQVDGTAHINDRIDVERALQTLPEEQREVLLLRLWEDLSLQETADLQQVPLQTVASRYRYALKKLEEMLECPS